MNTMSSFVSGLSQRNAVTILHRKGELVDCDYHDSIVRFHMLKLLYNECTKERVCHIGIELSYY